MYNLDKPHEPLKMLVKISESIPIYEIQYDFKLKSWMGWGSNLEN